MKSLFLVKRGPKPESQKAPYHQVIVCSHRHTAAWEAMGTAEGAWLWEWSEPPASGMLLLKWKGLDIDYRPVVRGMQLPDGTVAGFQHDRNAEPWTLLPGAVWWSWKPMPKWLEPFGVVTAPDDFSREMIRRDLGDCLLSQSRRESLHRAKIAAAQPRRPAGAHFE